MCISEVKATNAIIKRHRWTKAEKQGIIHNYSLQRWTDQDIVKALLELMDSLEQKIKDQDRRLDVLLSSAT